MKRSRGNSLRYQVFRSEAMKLAKELVVANSGEFLGPETDPQNIHYEPITQAAIDASSLWGQEAELYPWEDVPAWKNKDIKAFDIALWYGPELCGLCFATPRDSVVRIKIVLLEAKPDKTHPLRGVVAPLALLAIDSYARMLECQEIEIQQPSAGATPWYEALGFTFTDDRRLVIAVKP